MPAKGLRVLMQALDDVRRALARAVCRRRPDGRELTAFTAEHPGRVHVLTGVAHDDVPAFLNAMDVLCAPSQTTARWREQFGRMLIEAMACGVPVIASRSGEIPYVVGDAGLVVDEADVAHGRPRSIDCWATRPAPRPVGTRYRSRAREVRLARGRPRAFGVFRGAL